jgi:hypothetical protein
MSVPIAGGSVVTLVPPSGTVGLGITSIAIDTTNLYWITADLSAEKSSVMKMPIGGGASTTLASYSSEYPPVSMTSDATSVYWAIDGDSSRSNGLILKVPIAGGAFVTLADSQDFPGPIAVDATSVYWSNQSAIVKLTPK